MSAMGYLSDRDIVIISRPLALALGVGQSIILRKLFAWLEYNQDEPLKAATHFRDGRWWSYNSYREWHENLKIYSESAVKRYLEDLEAYGIVLSTENYNRLSIDHTKWYTIDYEMYKSFMAAWKDAGEPNFNGGKGNADYKEFISQWVNRTNRPSGQLGQTITSNSSIQSDTAGQAACA